MNLHYTKKSDASREDGKNDNNDFNSESDYEETSDDEDNTMKSENADDDEYIDNGNSDNDLDVVKSNTRDEESVNTKENVTIQKGKYYYELIKPIILQMFIV